MNTKPFRYASFAMNLLEKLLGTRFTISGVEKIPNNPVMFVANHFTRSETFFVPYLINKATGRHVRCLADSKIFFGAFGRFLRSVGTVSTKDPNRDNIIVDDLVNGAYVMEDGTIQNWIGNGLDTVQLKQQILEKLQKIKDITES